MVNGPTYIKTFLKKNLLCTDLKRMYHWKPPKSFEIVEPSRNAPVSKPIRFPEWYIIFNHIDNTVWNSQHYCIHEYNIFYLHFSKSLHDSPKFLSQNFFYFFSSFLHFFFFRLKSVDLCFKKVSIYCFHKGQKNNQWK